MITLEFETPYGGLRGKPRVVLASTFTVPLRRSMRINQPARIQCRLTVGHHTLSPRTPSHAWPAPLISQRLDCMTAMAQALQIAIIKPPLRRYRNRYDVINHIGRNYNPVVTFSTMPAQRLIHQVL
jgi:hypothetical protein